MRIASTTTASALLLSVGTTARPSGGSFLSVLLSAAEDEASQGGVGETEPEGHGGANEATHAMVQQDEAHAPVAQNDLNPHGAAVAAAARRTDASGEKSAPVPRNVNRGAGGASERDIEAPVLAGCATTRALTHGAQRPVATAAAPLMRTEAASATLRPTPTSAAQQVASPGGYGIAGARANPMVRSMPRQANAPATAVSHGGSAAVATIVSPIHLAAAALKTKAIAVVETSAGEREALPVGQKQPPGATWRTAPTADPLTAVLAHASARPLRTGSLPGLAGREVPANTSGQSRSANAMINGGAGMMLATPVVTSMRSERNQLAGAPGGAQTGIERPADPAMSGTENVVAAQSSAGQQVAVRASDNLRGDSVGRHAPAIDGGETASVPGRVKAAAPLPTDGAAPSIAAKPTSALPVAQVEGAAERADAGHVTAANNDATMLRQLQAAMRSTAGDAREAKGPTVSSEPQFSAAPIRVDDPLRLRISEGGGSDAVAGTNAGAMAGVGAAALPISLRTPIAGNRTSNRMTEQGGLPVAWNLPQVAAVLQSAVVTVASTPRALQNAESGAERVAAAPGTERAIDAQSDAGSAAPAVESAGTRWPVAMATQSAQRDDTVVSAPFEVRGNEGATGPRATAASTAISHGDSDAPVLSEQDAAPARTAAANGAFRGIVDGTVQAQSGSFTDSHASEQTSTPESGNGLAQTVTGEHSVQPPTHEAASTARVPVVQGRAEVSAVQADTTVSKPVVRPVVAVVTESSADTANGATAQPVGDAPAWSPEEAAPQRAVVAPAVILGVADGAAQGQRSASAGPGASDRAATAVIKNGMPQAAIAGIDLPAGVQTASATPGAPAAQGWTETTAVRVAAVVARPLTQPVARGSAVSDKPAPVAASARHGNQAGAGVAQASTSAAATTTAAPVRAQGLPIAAAPASFGGGSTKMPGATNSNVGGATATDKNAMGKDATGTSTAANAGPAGTGDKALSKAADSTRPADAAQHGGQGDAQAPPSAPTDAGHATDSAPRPADAGAAQAQTVAVQAAIPAAQATHGGAATVETAPRGAAQPGMPVAAHGDGVETAGASSINSARLMQTVGETEMHVGMRTAEFGDISIRTSVSAQQLVAQIAVDHGGLGQAISAHISTMQSKLGEDSGLQTSIEVRHLGSSLSGETGQSSQREQRAFNYGGSAESASQTTEEASGPGMGIGLGAMAAVGDGSRLDIRA